MQRGFGDGNGLGIPLDLMEKQVGSSSLGVGIAVCLSGAARAVNAN